jgi:hypothetical protein
MMKKRYELADKAIETFCILEALQYQLRDIRMGMVEGSSTKVLNRFREKDREFRQLVYEWVLLANKEEK